MEVFNSVYNDTKDEGRAMAAAYSAIRKAQYANDIFTTEMEARARSMDLGLEGRIHVCDYDEQAVYMPGESEEEYLNFYRQAAGLPLETEDDEEEGDYPETEDGPSEARLEALRVVIQEILKEDLQKAQYRGKEVTLNKPRRLRGGKKKFEVFVMDGDKVKRVTFGDPDLEIRRDNPEARASFRARHQCDTATDKTSARYWSCRFWEGDTTVSELTKNFEAYGEVTKIDSEQRIVYGFASVVSKNGEMIVDRQGDVITAEEMEKAATNFMLGARNGLTMHKGEPTTTIVHSLPLTKQVMDAFGITSDKEGWLIAVKVHDDDTWDRMKKGEFTGFSIGGRARKVQLDD
jgi:hypothetical protein